MQIIMDDMRLNHISELEAFLQGSKKVAVVLPSIAEKYAFIEQTVERFSYRTLKRREKHTVYLYLRKVTGYKKVQLHRLIARALTGDLKRKPYVRENATRIYLPGDIRLLEQTDIQEYCRTLQRCFVPLSP